VCVNYKSNDRGMDEFVAENEDMLVLMAAGNAGPDWQVISCVWS
jgi:hypothetical protein